MAVASHDRACRFKKLQFHWTTREYESLSWFSRELSDLVAMDTENRLEIHQHLTGVKGDAQCPERQLVNRVQQKAHSVDGVDVISGVKGAKHLTHLGRPNWDTHFKAITEEFHGVQVGVFYCGPTALQNVIQESCIRNSGHRAEGGTKFYFYHENF